MIRTVSNGAMVESAVHLVSLPTPRMATPEARWDYRHCLPFEFQVKSVKLESDDLSAAIFDAARHSVDHASR